MILEINKQYQQQIVNPLWQISTSQPYLAIILAAANQRREFIIIPNCDWLQAKVRRDRRGRRLVDRVRFSSFLHFTVQSYQ